MTDPAPNRRPWVAAALSVLFPGLGHAYLRAWLRMTMWLALMFSAAALIIPPEIVPQEVTVESMLAAYRDVPPDVSFALLALQTLVVVDAYMVGRRTTDRTAIEAGRQCPNCGQELEDPDLSFCPWCATELEADDGSADAPSRP